jgi:glycosyltransferase involved in cell wall biosynthesis
VYKSKKVSIINHFPNGYALARYTNSLAYIDQGLTDIINVKFNPSVNDFPEGFIYYGTKSKMINVLARNIVYKSLKERLKNNLEKGNLVHYTEQSMPMLTHGSDLEIVTFHDLFALNEKKGFTNTIFKNFTLKFLEFNNAIAVSNTTRATLEDMSFKGNLTTIYNGIPEIFHPRQNKKHLREKYGLPLDKKLIVSVSSDAPRKNLQFLKIIGKMLKNTFEIIRVGPSVGFRFSFNNISDNGLAEIYSACDAFILTSTLEGFNYPVTEAMATGLPVIVPDLEIMKEVTNSAGILCKLNDAASFIEGLEEALDQKDKYSRLSMDRAKTFMMDKFIKEMTSYYQKLF